jgi:hypothetical protein
MLLTNQKTINYENLYETRKETTPPLFTDAKIQHISRFFKKKIKFNITFTPL